MTFRRARTPPATSLGRTPRVRRPMRMAATWTGEASPETTAEKTLSASSAERAWPLGHLLDEGLEVQARPLFRLMHPFQSSCLPAPDRRNPLTVCTGPPGG